MMAPVNKRAVQGIGILLAGLLLLSVISLTGCGGVSGQTGNEDTAPFYTDRVVTVRFTMPEGDWEHMQANTRAEEYVKADMWYGGDLIPDIALRPKGNSSLMTTVSRNSNRFSLKADLNFFNSARNLDGVKKLNFNNGFSDPSFIREVLSYDLYRQMGIPTPRTSFVDIWINDTHLGLYTMVEQIDKTFLDAHFADSCGNLYKPEMPAAYLNWTEADLTESQTITEDPDSLEVNLGGGKLGEIMRALGQGEETEEESPAPGFGGFPGGDIPPGTLPAGMPFGNMPSANVTPRFGGMGRIPFGNMPSDNVTPRFGRVPMPFGNAPPGGMGPPQGGAVGPGMMAGGQRGSLVEQMALKTNENKPDYSALFRLLDVLNNEPDVTFRPEIKKILDVDQVLRFLAVSTVLVHLDNYTGMGHNYYLYEVDGEFTILPWDLNMSFGGFDAGLDRNGIINFYIDEPTAGAVADRPLVHRLLSVPAYLETYHGYLRELIDGPFSCEVMEAKIDALADLIRPYVQADTTKFFTDSDFESFLGEGGRTDVEIRRRGMGINIGLKAFVRERIQSVQRQLNGELPSTNNGQGNQGTMPGMGFGGGPAPVAP